MNGVLMAIGLFATVGTFCLVADAIKETVRIFGKPAPKAPERPPINRL